MVNWSEFQKDVGVWSHDRFGDQPATNPFLGTAEEMSELVVELLEEDPSDDEVLDAVGDILVFFADYCTRADIPYEKAAELRSNVDLLTPCESVEDLCVEVTVSRGNQAYSYLKQDQGIRNEREGVGQTADIQSLAHTLSALETFSENRGFTLSEAIEEAWGEVQEREWDSSYN